MLALVKKIMRSYFRNVFDFYPLQTQPYLIFFRIGFTKYYFNQPKFIAYEHA